MGHLAHTSIHNLKTPTISPIMEFKTTSSVRTIIKKSHEHKGVLVEDFVNVMTM
jgi:hypothetical protein